MPFCSDDADLRQATSSLLRGAFVHCDPQLPPIPRCIRAQWAALGQGAASDAQPRPWAFPAADLTSILAGMPETVTTIKVPRSLRERIAARAGQQRMTAAEVIAELLDDADRR